MDSLFAVLLGYAIPGMAIAIGIMLVVARFNVRTRLWLYGHPLILEVGGTALAWCMHGGTIVGGMAVVVAGVCIYLVVCTMRVVYGYSAGGVYYRGWKKYAEADVLTAGQIEALEEAAAATV